MIIRETCQSCGERKDCIYHFRLQVYICHRCITDCNLEGQKIEREFTEAEFDGEILR